MIQTITRLNSVVVAISLLNTCGGRTDDFVVADNVNSTGGALVVGYVGGASTMSTGGTSATGGSAGCTSRPEMYSITTNFPFQSSSDANQYPNCVPTCGLGYDVQPSGVPTVVALPAGPCDSEATCLMAATPCACGGNVSGYVCTCVNARWSCVDASPGAGVCLSNPTGGC